MKGLALILEQNNNTPGFKLLDMILGPQLYHGVGTDERGVEYRYLVDSEPPHFDCIAARYEDGKVASVGVYEKFIQYMPIGKKEFEKILSDWLDINL